MKRARIPTVYILASKRNGTLYIGVTSNLAQRMAQHSQGHMEGFTKKYGVKTLVWHSSFASMEAAISREKQLKEWRRIWKVRLIEETNPAWANLYDEASGEILPGPAEAERLSAEPVQSSELSGYRPAPV